MFNNRDMPYLPNFLRLTQMKLRIAIENLSVIKMWKGKGKGKMNGDTGLGRRRLCYEPMKNEK